MNMVSKSVMTSASILAACALSAPAQAQGPAAAYDGEWLTVRGTVVSSDPDSFLLDYGAKTIPVEMDDYDWYNENVVLPGDRVTVAGRLDRDFLENRKIEASSVYVDKLHTTFFASAADEEATILPWAHIWSGAGGGSVSLTGEVRSIDGEEMIVDAGLLEYKVDVGPLDYDPFDAAGVQHIAVGDRVSVFGEMDDADLFDRREIAAVSVTELAG